MIRLLYGDNTVGVEDALAESMRDVGPEDLRDINSAVIRAENATPEMVTAAVFTVPFMTDRRTVVVKDLLTEFESKRSRRGASSRGSRRRDPLGPWAGLVEQLPAMPATTRLTFVDGPLGKSNPMLKRLAPMSEIDEFRMPSDRDMSRWIADRSKEIGVRIEPSACAALADAVGRQPMLIDSELRKLSLYCGGRRVGVEDVRNMVAYVREANIFQAVDAVIDGKAGVALRMAGRVMDDGGSAAYMMSMIARQIRLLLMVTDLMAQRQPQNEIGRRVRLSGWVLNKTLQQARRASFERLKRMHALLVETDLTLKTKPIEERLALEILIVELTSRRA